MKRTAVALPSSPTPLLPSTTAHILITFNTLCERTLFPISTKKLIYLLLLDNFSYFKLSVSLTLCPLLCTRRAKEVSFHTLFRIYFRQHQVFHWVFWALSNFSSDVVFFFTVHAFNRMAKGFCCWHSLLCCRWYDFEPCSFVNILPSGALNFKVHLLA